MFGPVVLALAVLGALVLACAGLGYRVGLWGLKPALGMLGASALVAGGAIVLALFGLARAAMAGSWSAAVVALLALLIGAGTAAVPLGMRRAAQSVPFIHDITTDLDRPPEFAALRAARERSPNGAAYGGPAIARLQAQGYPDLRSLQLALPPDQAFQRAEAAAVALGWTIAAAVPAEGRLEASDTSRWFGFVDDVVVRVSPEPGGSRLDVRSASRVGQSDLGVNAKRIGAFLAKLSVR